MERINTPHSTGHGHVKYCYCHGFLIVFKFNVTQNKGHIVHFGFQVQSWSEQKDRESRDHMQQSHKHSHTQKPKRNSSTRSHAGHRCRREGENGAMPRNGWPLAFGVEIDRWVTFGAVGDANDNVCQEFDFFSGFVHRWWDKARNSALVKHMLCDAECANSHRINNFVIFSGTYKFFIVNYKTNSRVKLLMIWCFLCISREGNTIWRHIYVHRGQSKHPPHVVGWVLAQQNKPRAGRGGGQFPGVLIPKKCAKPNWPRNNFLRGKQIQANTPLVGRGRKYRIFLHNIVRTENVPMRECLAYLIDYWNLIKVFIFVKWIF